MVTGGRLDLTKNRAAFVDIVKCSIIPILVISALAVVIREIFAHAVHLHKRLYRCMHFRVNDAFHAFMLKHGD